MYALILANAVLFLSTLSLRRATCCARFRCWVLSNISIHALLAESDFNGASPLTSRANFYPRSPCGERRPNPICIMVAIIISIHALLAESDPDRVSETLVPRQFLSTLSLRRATIDSSRAANCQQHFYPRSPCGERRITDGSICLDSKISIHALLAESDRAESGQQRSPHNFYPRSPCGERRRAKTTDMTQRHFYPRSPCGERPRTLI